MKNLFHTTAVRLFLLALAVAALAAGTNYFWPARDKAPEPAEFPSANAPAPHAMPARQAARDGGSRIGVMAEAEIPQNAVAQPRGGTVDVPKETQVAGGGQVASAGQAVSGEKAAVAGVVPAASSAETVVVPFVEWAPLTGAAAEAAFYARLNRLSPDAALRMKTRILAMSQRYDPAKRAAKSTGFVPRP